MTEEEAKIILQTESRHHPETSIFGEALQQAIKALEEISLYKQGGLCLIPADVFKKLCEELDSYKELGTVEELRVARDKQVAKKEEWIFDEFTATFGKPYRCSNCEEEFDDTYNYCPNCGCDMYTD